MTFRGLEDDVEIPVATIDVAINVCSEVSGLAAPELIPQYAAKRDPSL